MSPFDTLLAGLTDEQRLQYLEDNAANVFDNHFYMRKLSDSELAADKDDFADAHKLMEEVTAEKKAAVAGFEQQLKALKNRAKEKLLRIKTGHEEMRETVYEMHDEVDKYIYLYNAAGELVNQRKMRTGTQLAFKMQVDKTGTED